ncbi:hypothetical protein BH09BAC2_BH09BAC2_18520 [soil metagenome]
MKTLLALTFIFLSITAIAQEEEKQEVKRGFDKTNLFTGGSISLGLGSGSFNAGLHPHFGYTLAKWIDAAAVVNFEYTGQRDYYNNKYRNTTIGLGVFTRIFPVKFIFLQAQPEYNFINLKYIPASGESLKQKANAPSLLVGGGYTTSRSDKNTFTYLSILVDVLKDENSPYVDGYGNLLPVIRAGINIGLGGKKARRAL